MNPSHVIIRGHVFTLEEKAPFETSGCSLLGALEYDKEQDLTRCHECGNWIKNVSYHVKAHQLTGREYKQRHGLTTRTSLSNMATRANRQHIAKSLFSEKKILQSPNIARARGKAPNRVHPAGVATEISNEASRCRAQITFRIQTLASQNAGVTPTEKQLALIGISRSVMRLRFGSVARAMRMAGLTPNKPCRIKKRFGERMPWPEDYFKVGYRP